MQTVVDGVGTGIARHDGPREIRGMRDDVTGSIAATDYYVVGVTRRSDRRNAE